MSACKCRSIECENADNALLPCEVDCCDFDENGIIMDVDIEWVQAVSYTHLTLPTIYSV